MAVTSISGGDWFRQTETIEVNSTDSKHFRMTEPRDQTSSPAIMKMVEQVIERGDRALLITSMSGPSIGEKLLILEDATIAGTLGNPELDSLVANEASRFLSARDDTRMISVSEFAPEFSQARDSSLLCERIQPAPRLVVFGAGHVGASLARIAVFAGYHTTLIDDRADFLKRELFPEKQITLLIADDWGTAARAAIGNGRGVSVAVVTRGHNEDEQCMQAVVRANPDYVGLIGSKRRTSIVIERLREAGATQDQLRNIRAPIGLDIGAVSPQEVALAVMAEIVAERRGRSGGSLSAWRRAKSD